MPNKRSSKKVTRRGLLHSKLVVNLHKHALLVVTRIYYLEALFTFTKIYLNYCWVCHACDDPSETSDPPLHMINPNINWHSAYVLLFQRHHPRLTWSLHNLDTKPNICDLHIWRQTLFKMQLLFRRVLFVLFSILFILFTININPFKQEFVVQSNCIEWKRFQLRTQRILNF